MNMRMIGWFCWTALLLLPADLTPQQEKIQENVMVVNVEVPVRVYEKGKAVTDLTKEDFELQVSGRKIEINGFYRRVKKLQRRVIGDRLEQAPPAAEPAAPPRTLVLMFDICSPNQRLKDGLAQVFRKFLQKGDHLLVFLNGATLDYPNLAQPDKLQEEIWEQIKQRSVLRRMRIDGIANQIERHVSTRNLKSGSDTSVDDLSDFIDNYRTLWHQFKMTALVPDLQPFFLFARYLEKIKGEKWVLNFQQYEVFPRLIFGSQLELTIKGIIANMQVSSDPMHNARARILTQKLHELEKEFLFHDDFPVDEVSKLFYQANATFHVFFLHNRRDSAAEDFRFTQVLNEMELVLDRVARATGGTSQLNDDLEDALGRVEEVEDVSYMLTYSPADLPSGPRPTVVRVKNRRCDVRFDDGKRPEYMQDFVRRMDARLATPTVAVNKVEYSDRVLSFTLSDYLRRDGNASLQLRVRVISEQSQTVFDQSRTTATAKPDMAVRLHLPPFAAGGYYIFVEAADLLTGKRAEAQLPISVQGK